MPVRTLSYVNLTGVGKLIEKEIRRFLVVWVQTLLGPLISGMLFLLIFVVVLQKQRLGTTGIDYVTFLAPGLVAMTMFQNAFANSSSSILIGKVSRSIEDVLMAPMRPSEIVFGYLVGGVSRGLISGVLLWIAFLPFVQFTSINLPLMVLFAIGGSAIFALLGVLGGTLARRMEHIAFMSQIVVAPLTILSGTFYSADQVPAGARAAIELNPVYYLIDGFRQGVLGIGGANTTLGVSVIAILFVSLFVICTLVWKHGYGLRS